MENLGKKYNSIIPLMEDDYLEIEVMSSNNLSFAKELLKKPESEYKIKKIETEVLGISKKQLINLLKSVGLCEYEKIIYIGGGEPEVLENPKTRAFGSYDSAIFFDGNFENVEHIWLYFDDWIELTKTNILNGLNAIGNKYNMILVDTYPIQNKIVDLKNKEEIQNYLDVYINYEK